MGYIDFSMLVVFLIGMFTIGWLLSRWIDTADDFMVAGRNLTPFILAAALTAANVNLYSFIGQSGTAYKHGISIVWQTWTGNMGLVFSGLIIIPIMRSVSRYEPCPNSWALRYNCGRTHADRNLLGIQAQLLAWNRAAGRGHGIQDYRHSSRACRLPSSLSFLAVHFRRHRGGVYVSGRDVVCYHHRCDTVRADAGRGADPAADGDEQGGGGGAGFRGWWTRLKRRPHEPGAADG